ncbi:recombinase family protein [Bradyrhizobium brasilense]|uniref:recombinase family protein n=1 Tax=Bradyrhizobium brasilense TaxID=1419277 RepID=UPI000B808812|nr:recombinase family protein [Bradyrhizobium brasilense]
MAIAADTTACRRCQRHGEVNPIRVAICAHYSSDRQKDRSVEDQIAFCRDNAARNGMTVVTTFEDRQISGAGAVNRPRFQALMRSAEAGLFDTIVAEDLNRLCARIAAASTWTTLKRSRSRDCVRTSLTPR